jgi:hypothetical protein
MSKVEKNRAMADECKRLMEQYDNASSEVSTDSLPSMRRFFEAAEAWTNALLAAKKPKKTGGA